MLLSVECPVCGHRELGVMEFCPECGAAVFSSVLADTSNHDEDFHLNILESGDISYVPHLIQTVGCRQLREICDAARQGRLEDESFQSLLAELEVYLEREKLKIDLLPEIDNENYSNALILVSDGLEGLLEACAVAADYPLQGKAALNLAVKMAADADVQIGQGRQILDRLNW